MIFMSFNISFSPQLAFYEPFMNLNKFFLKGFLKEDSGFYF